MKTLIVVLSIIFGTTAFAGSHLEGAWYSKDGKRVSFTEFQGSLTLHTRSYYSSGAPSDYFFEFKKPAGRDVQAGEVIEGRLRSLDGHYGCVFDEPAKLVLGNDGTLKVNFPLLVFHREIREAKETIGHGYQRTVDWTRWGWVETVYNFPIEQWRVISSRCIIDKKIPTTSLLSR